jgi:hypothetical protein
MTTLKIGQVYRHYKGALIRVTSLEKHSETLEEHVGYVHVDQYGAQVDDLTWTRPLKMWDNNIDCSKPGSNRTVKRFELAFTESSLHLFEIDEAFFIARTAKEAIQMHKEQFNSDCSLVVEQWNDNRMFILQDEDTGKTETHPAGFFAHREGPGLFTWVDC